MFERECASVAMSQGIIPPRDFSTGELFKRISSSVRPIPAMIRAVQIIKIAGGIMNKISSNCTNNGFIMLGFKTGVITNNWIDDTSNQTNQLSRFLSEHFDVVLQSCLLGIQKPNPIIYRLACQRLGIEPTEVYTYVCLCVGCMVLIYFDTMLYSY